MKEVLTVITRVENTNSFHIFTFESEERASNYFRTHNYNIIYSKMIDEDVYYTVVVDKSEYMSNI